MQAQKPVVALVGRPNVGKSTLFNRLIGRPTAIVEDVPGTTRDRIYGESDWNGVGFIVIDTGGLETPETMRTGRQTEAPPTAGAAPSAPGFTNFVQNQAQVAIAEADAIVLLVDGRSGLTAADEDVAEVLRRSDKPVFIAVNKAENQRVQQNAVDFWSLGLGEPYPISAYHGNGVADMLDELVKVLSPYPIDEEEEKTIGIAIVGRPNVGKSSLLNVLVGHERAIVSEVPGTTRDPIDMQITYDGERITLIDTAGIRRRGRVEQGIEQYSVLRSMRAIDRADVALLLIDAQEGVTAQDMHVAGYVLERNKSVVLLINKWDAIEKDSQTMVEYAKTVREQLAFLDYVPVLFISAKTRQRVNKVLPTALQVVAARRHRLSTSEVNQVLTEAYEAVQIPMRHGRTLRLYYGTQVGNEPPTFVIFVNHEELVHFSYSRYLENRIRAYYPFEGTPIKLLFRSRDRNEK
ncbi:MAG: ribosome biogenesis GTPase Der [Caldilineaceae bacterium]|jgi:GTP-binding protein|nr:ribosome biogenesis GTPase Der [Caldilineaceae bacterium]